ncbi:chemotaxis protein CheA, partial [Paenibacillus polymyxa]|nr:chemotaxis protein CheA [Paenibacillus polymyxa]
TQVDRDILEKLDAPLMHLLRNAVDHGIESPAQRERTGKPAEGLITLSARHSAGMLLVELADDGSGISLDHLREEVVERKLTNAETAARLS